MEVELADKVKVVYSQVVAVVVDVASKIVAAVDAAPDNEKLLEAQSWHNSIATNETRDLVLATERTHNIPAVEEVEQGKAIEHTEIADHVERTTVKVGYSSCGDAVGVEAADEKGLEHILQEVEEKLNEGDNCCCVRLLLLLHHCWV